MKKNIVIILILLAMALTACGTSNNAAPNFGGNATGEVPAVTKLIVGTLKLEETENSVTPEQASNLLPLWQVYQSLTESDTAAQEEIDALAEQIADTMTAEQSQAITDMQITQQDMFGIMQTQGAAMGGGASQAGTGNQSNTGGGNNFGPPDGGGMPGGGMPGGGPGGTSGQGLSTAQTTDAQATSGTRPSGTPTALIEAVIQYLKDKAGS